MVKAAVWGKQEHRESKMRREPAHDSKIPRIVRYFVCANRDAGARACTGMCQHCCWCGVSYLSRSRLGLSNHVPPLQYARQGFFLNGRWSVKAHLIERLQQVRRQMGQIGKTGALGTQVTGRVALNDAQPIAIAINRLPLQGQLLQAFRQRIGIVAVATTAAARWWSIFSSAAGVTVRPEVCRIGARSENVRV
jgi:hypothetical protein